MTLASPEIILLSLLHLSPASQCHRTSASLSFILFAFWLLLSRLSTVSRLGILLSFLSFFSLFPIDLLLPQKRSLSVILTDLPLIFNLCDSIRTPWILFLRPL
ncbi:hypothetical protein P170DRAFT_159566 [Aspergillus steynii IBT 23096]|uniref:Uncharacterized protein n=1 Tax=Aspergillus steynii IBT 23096 TaxID=1392250 RepID=A0A2I2GDV2_9EURO|nr:uncharacterized protein P170DRAFT_159566 [Aspergillus steynii IBT 23096]PLB51079.1 hypothetical protein P170DRAFT_159566 [Aspergillus steynii IBT 23096]